VVTKSTRMTRLQRNQLFKLNLEGTPEIHHATATTQITRIDSLLFLDAPSWSLYSIMDLRDL
jgi:hypothetical protein